LENKLGNPAPLGLFAFASTTWLLSLVNAGIADGKGLVLVLAMALVFGGTVQAIAGIIAFMRGNTFPGVAFLAYGAFWISLVTYAKFFGGGAGPFIGWYLFVWGVFSFYMWIASFRHNTALQLTFLALWITFLLLVIGDGFGVPQSTVAGGYLGLVTAALAAYVSAAEIINGDYGRTVLPIGPYVAAKASTRTEAGAKPQLAS
jgi:succinate-acetate transporter protein